MILKKTFLYNAALKHQFNYCPLVWHTLKSGPGPGPRPSEKADPRKSQPYTKINS